MPLGMRSPRISCGPNRQMGAWLTTVQRIMPDDCWNWPWHKNDDGYGRLRVGTRKLMAHRVVYERLRGPIPIGLQTDHLCRNPKCCNPDHLELVRPEVNVARSSAPNVINAVKTHCRHGHILDAANTALRPNIRKDGLPQRACRRCAMLRQREYRRRRSNQERP